LACRRCGFASGGGGGNEQKPSNDEGGGCSVLTIGGGGVAVGGGVRVIRKPRAVISREGIVGVFYVGFGGGCDN